MKAMRDLHLLLAFVAGTSALAQDELVAYVPRKHIDRTADVRDDSGNTVLVRVAVDKDTLPDLRDGAKVTARVHCGERPLGYVLFHDLIETVQAKVLFWF